MKSVKPVTLAAFNSHAEAEALQQRLVAAGIAAAIQSESRPEADAEYSRLSAGVQVQVPRADFEVALKVVFDWNAAKEMERSLPGPLGPASHGSDSYCASGVSSAS